MQLADCQGILIHDIDVYAHEVIDNTSSVRLYITSKLTAIKGHSASLALITTITAEVAWVLWM